MLVRTPNCAVLDTWFKPFAHLPTATVVEATVDEDRPKQPDEMVQVHVPGSDLLAPHGWGWTQWGNLEPMRERARSRLERLVGPDPW